MKPPIFRPLILSLYLGASLSATPLLAADEQPADAAKTKAVLSVTATRLQQQEWPLQIRANGGLFAWQEAVIAAETGGLRVTELLADVGSQIKKGDKLIQLSNEMVEASVANKRALVSQARAELAEAEANAKRTVKAKGANAFSEQQTTQYLVARDKARANLEAAEAQLKMEQIRLQQTSVLAVDDGVISVRNATLGEVVQTGSVLFRMLRHNRLEWRAELIAEQLQQVKRGQSVKLQLSDGSELQGTVRVVSPTIDPQSRKGLVYVDLPESSGRAGMFARGEIRLGSERAMTVPESALVIRDGFSYLFELNAAGKVTQRKVVTGRRIGGQVEILDGVNPEARFVASGGAFLNSGDTVRIVDAAAEVAQ